MSEIKRPEQQTDAPKETNITKELEGQKKELNDSNNSLDNLDTFDDNRSGLSDVKTSDSSKTDKVKDEKQLSLDNLDDVKFEKDDSGTHGEDKKPEKVQEKEQYTPAYTKEKFSEGNSYDAKIKESSSEVFGLHNKCTYETKPMGQEDTEGMRTPRAEYTQEEIKTLKEARDAVPPPDENTVMQKVIGVDTGNIEKDLDRFLNPRDREGNETSAKVGGFVAKAEDAAPFTSTPKDAHDNLRLDYEGSQYQSPDTSIYVVRYTGDSGDTCNIPYSAEFGGTMDAFPPTTGNGFVAGEEHIIPEYHSSGTELTSGEIYRINPDGTEELVAYYDEDSERFKLYKGDENK